MKRRLYAGQWAAKRKPPWTKSKTAKFTAMQLAEMRDAGIKFLGILGSPNAGESCEACLAMKDDKIEIEFANPLPLPGCDKKICKCLYLAVA